MKYLKRWWTWLFSEPPGAKKIDPHVQWLLEIREEAIKVSHQKWLDEKKQKEAAKIQDRIDKDEEYRRMARIFKEVWKDDV